MKRTVRPCSVWGSETLAPQPRLEPGTRGLSARCPEMKRGRAWRPPENIWLPDLDSNQGPAGWRTLQQCTFDPSHVRVVRQQPSNSRPWPTLLRSTRRGPSPTEILVRRRPGCSKEGRADALVVQREATESRHLQSLRSPARIARKRTCQERSHVTPGDALAAELNGLKELKELEYGCSFRTCASLTSARGADEDAGSRGACKHLENRMGLDHIPLTGRP